MTLSTAANIDKKEEYRKYLSANDSLPIYLQDWYLDLVCGKDNWNVVLAYKNNEVVAFLPYYLKKNRFFSWIAMPPLSKLHGPYIKEGFNSMRHHHALIDELLDQLPDIAFYQQACGYDFRNWLPYLWRGYVQVTLYSYVFNDLNLENILAGMESDYRRRIKKAERELMVRHDLPYKLFYETLIKTYERQKLPVPFDPVFLEKYYQDLKARSLAELFFVLDQENNVQSVAMLIWDKHCSYYLLEGTDPFAKDKNAGTYIKWLAIKYTKEILGLNRFDFEGSISRRIEKIYREFGASAEPYYVIKKYNSRLFLFLKFIQNYRQYGKLAQW
ncbi:MAG: GNAT family N-acetyltransferase [Bacteroidetes bacterium]|nr:GNAT family N-acetyltransferase [Bacteroidota bacterium]